MFLSLLSLLSLLTNHVSWKLNFVFPENITDLIEVEGTSGHFSTKYQKIGRSLLDSWYFHSKDGPVNIFIKHIRKLGNEGK